MQHFTNIVKLIPLPFTAKFCIWPPLWTEEKDGDDLSSLRTNKKHKKIPRDEYYHETFEVETLVAN